MTATDARHDIEDRADLERLVRAFYGRTLTDPVLGFIFNDVAHLDLEAHVPVITSFWETILLGAHTYAGGAFAKHADLHHKVPLRAGHFERWLFLWRMTVDELFAGPRADEAKSHANRVARAFHQRLEGRAAEAAPTAATGLAIRPYPTTSGAQTPRSGG